MNPERDIVEGANEGIRVMIALTTPIRLLQKTRSDSSLRSFDRQIFTANYRVFHRLTKLLSSHR